MQSLDYGSFLTKEKKNRTAYEHSKPLFRLGFLAFFAFSLGCLVTMGAGYAYVYYTKPVPVVTGEEYNRTHKLSLDVNKAIAVVKNARPNGIDAVEAVGTFSDAASALKDKIALVDIAVTPDSYVARGVATDIKSCDAYLKSLAFPEGRFTKELSDVKSSDTKEADEGPARVDFTVKVTPRATAAPNGADAAKKGVDA